MNKQKTINSTNSTIQDKVTNSHNSVHTKPNGVDSVADRGHTN